MCVGSVGGVVLGLYVSWHKARYGVVFRGGVFIYMALYDCDCVVV